MSKEGFEKNIWGDSERIKRTAEIQNAIDVSEERTWEQIEISDKVYRPKDGDMVELPDGSVGGIMVAIPDKEGKYTVVLEDGLEVKAPANKLLLRGCWTAHKRYLNERQKGI